MAADVDVRELCLDGRHVAADAVAALRAWLVVRVLLERARVRTVRRFRSVAGQTQHLGRLEEIGIVLRPVDVVTAEAGNAALVHHALGEVVPLHPVLVRRAVREMRERRLAELMLLELPEVLEPETGPEPDGPVVVLAFDRLRERLPL